MSQPYGYVDRYMYGYSPFSYSGKAHMQPTQVNRCVNLLEPSRPQDTFVQYKAFDVGYMLAQGQQNNLGAGGPLTPGPRLELAHRGPRSEQAALQLFKSLSK